MKYSVKQQVSTYTCIEIAICRLPEYNLHFYTPENISDKKNKSDTLDVHRTCSMEVFCFLIT